MRDKKKLQLPEGAVEITPSKTSKTTFDKGSELLADQLMTSEWHPYFSRPRTDHVGLYVILKWFAKQATWVPLYIDYAPVCNSLNRHFSGKDKSAIARYLSSFPKSERKLIWIKWHQDLMDFTQNVDIAEVMKVVSTKYNNDERPPFNFEKEEKLPDNFSILS